MANVVPDSFKTDLLKGTNLILIPLVDQLLNLLCTQTFQV